MNKNNNKMDLLGNAPVPQALMALGIPIMIGMLINALYNLVDAYFIGGLGESQMGAISIAFPLGQVVTSSCWFRSDVWQWCRLLLIKTFRARR